MKINCGPSREARFKAEQEWHRWFAWRPVRVSETDCRWLEVVERKGEYDRSLHLYSMATGSGFAWTYRESEGT